VKSPIRQVLLYQKVRVLLGIGALAISTAINYLILYMATYAWLGAFPPPSAISRRAITLP
jgi:MFS transporter, MHS family, proline/betaine transporter